MKSATKNRDRWLVAALLFQILKENRDKLLHKVLKRRPVKPLMKYREIEIIIEVLRRLKPERVLEWGAGYSTFYFSQFAGKDVKWFSIEHQGNWAQRVKAMNTNQNVEIFHVEPDHFPWTDEFNDGSYSDLKQYIDFADRFKYLDLIFIDGRARKDAVIKAFELVKDDGIVILHDANRTCYHEPLKLFKYQALFTDRRNDSGGIWVGSKGFEINAVLDVALHKRIWKIYNMFQKVLG